MSKSATTWFPFAGLLLVCAAQQAGGCTLDVAGTGPSVAGTGAAGGTTSGSSSGGGGGGGGGGAGTSGSGGAGPSTSTGGGEGGGGGSNTGGGGGAGGGVVVPGYSLEFSSDTGSYVQVGNLVIPQNFTVEAWVKRDGGQDGERMLLAKDQRNQTASQFRLLVEGSGRVAFMMSNASSQDGGLYDSAASEYEVRSTTTLPDGVWTHVAVSKGGATFRIYVNGVQEASFTASQDLNHGGTQPFRIGSRVGPNGTSPNEVFDGQIDEVRLWDVARSQAEIQGAMAQTLNPLMAGPQGLVLSYRFDEGSGTTASDQLGMHPGTLVNGPAWVEDDAAP